jgi:hypothetical protein
MMTRTDYILEDTTRAHWPGVRAWRSRSTAPGRGYHTADDAQRRARQIATDYAAREEGPR